MSLKMLDENDLPHELLLTTRKKTKLKIAFNNNMSLMSLYIYIYVFTFQHYIHFTEIMNNK